MEKKKMELNFSIFSFIHENRKDSPLYSMKSSIVAAIFGLVTANAQNMAYYTTTTSSDSKGGQGSLYSNGGKAANMYTLDGDSRTSTSNLIGSIMSSNGLTAGKAGGSSSQTLSTGPGNGAFTTTTTTIRNISGGSGGNSGLSLGAGSGSGSGSFTVTGGSGSGLSLGGGSGLSLGGGSGTGHTLGGGSGAGGATFTVTSGGGSGLSLGSGSGTGLSLGAGSGSGSGGFTVTGGNSGFSVGNGNGFSIDGGNGISLGGGSGTGLSLGGGSGSFTVTGGSGSGLFTGGSGASIGNDNLSQIPRADLTRFYSQNSPQPTNFNSYRIINQASQTLVTPNRSLDSIFIRFPSSGELDRLIISADTAAILKTVQTIATDNSVACSQRITYLLEMLGRLRTAIEKKAYAADQLKIVINTSVSEVQRLQAEIENNKRAVTGLGIGDLKDRQARQIANLQDAYKRLNAVDGQTPVLQARVVGFEKEIQILTKNSEGERNRVANDKLKLVDVVGEIGNLQARLKQLLDKQAALNQSITKGQLKIAENDKNIGNLRKKIEQIEIEIKRLRDDSDRINSQVRDLEVKVERLRTDVAVAQTKKDRYLKQISILDDKINIQKKKAVEDDLNRMNQMITALRGLVPAVEGAIDRHYYNCYGDGSNVKVEQTGDVVVYVVSGDKFGDYLRSLYGNSVQVPSIRSDVVFNKVDIFGQDWQGRYGYPFMDSAFGSSDFSFSGSFNCLNPGSVVTGYGTISNIGPNFIEAKDERGANMRFNLGSCSRLEATHKTPKVGHKFYWSGVPGGQGYNLYGGSCFE